MYSTDVPEFAIANITCMTENSPPTNVTWMMDGSILDTDSQNYSVLQTVTNRRTSHYNTTLLIRNLPSIIGTHNFTCLISNIAGSDAKSITTKYFFHGMNILKLLLVWPSNINQFLYSNSSCKYSCVFSSHHFQRKNSFLHCTYRQQQCFQ